MTYRQDDAVAVLTRTPTLLRALLEGLPDVWTSATEGPNSWSPYDVVGHLIHGEHTDWLPRTEHMLAHGDRIPFPPFDREAMFATSRGKTLAELLATFEQLRRANLARLADLHLTEAQLDRPGRHPALGAVTLRQHLASWVVHDMSHLAQVARVMAKRYRDDVGPWRAYLPILDR